MGIPAHPLSVAQTEKVDILKACKKGPMQKLLPTMNEVVGA